MLSDTIAAELVAAMKAKESLKVDVFRGLKAAFVNELVATKRKPTDEVTDVDAVTVIRREVKKRKEAADAFRAGNRPELADKEDTERAILETYLPARMDQSTIRTAAEKKKSELGVVDKKDMGKLMGAVMKELGGKADGADVKVIIESLFS